MKRFWLSWYETSQDYRPINAPPNRAVLAWWCSGASGTNVPTLVALVEAEDESTAKTAIAVDWPPAEERVWRFCDEVAFDWRPGDRFPIDKPWELERVEGRR